MNNIIDLFCGAGGMTLGFEQAGFESVLSLDIWKDAINTFNKNRTNKVGVNKDIKSFKNEELIDLKNKYNVVGIVGGPPCQGFSMVGTRDAFDQRNQLYLEYVRFVEQINPKFFVLENVKGLLNLNNGFFKKDIIERFSRLGYNVNFEIIKASDHGVPQNRERVFFVGLKQEDFGDTFFEFPIGDKDRFVSTKEALSDLPSLDNGDDPSIYATVPQNDYQKLMRINSNVLFNNDITHHTDQTKNIISMIPDGGNINDLHEEYYKVRNYNAAFKRMNSELPSTTIDCGHRNYFHYNENRVPTVRESARIQSFPDNYIFYGSKTSQYTQVGNAVPPLVAKKIADQLMKTLKGE